MQPTPAVSPSTSKIPVLREANKTTKGKATQHPTKPPSPPAPREPTVAAAAQATFTTRADQVMGILTMAGHEVRQFFKDTTPPPKQLGLNKSPVPPKSSLILNTQEKCLEALDSVCSLKMSLLLQMKSTLMLSSEAKLRDSKGELKDAMKQIKEMNDLCNHIQDRYLWAKREPDVRKNYSKALSQLKEADSLEEEVIHLLRTKADYPPPAHVASASTGNAKTTADKVWEFASNYPCTSLGAAATLSSYGLLRGGYGSLSWMALGLGDYYHFGADKPIYSEAGKVVLSLADDARHVALPLSIAIAGTAYSYGERDWIRTAIGVGTAVQAGSFLYDKYQELDPARIKKSISLASLNLAKKWFKNGEKTGLIPAATSIFLGIYNGGVSGFVSPAHHFWNVMQGAAIYGLHFGAAKAFKYAND